MHQRPVLVGVAVAGVLLLVSLTLPNVRDGVAVAVGSVAAPIGQWGSNLGHTITAWWPGRVAAENRALEARVAKLTMETSRLATQLQEIRGLTELQSSLGERVLPTVGARVLLRNPDPAVQTLTLDRGTSDGIAVGSAVLAGDGLLIGRVRSVGERTCQVLLLTDPQSRATVEVENAAPSAGVIVGDRGTTAQLSNVRRDSPIAVGQPIVTSGIDAGVPRGIPVGTVGGITTRPADLFQTATVVLPATERTPAVVLVVQGARL